MGFLKWLIALPILIGCFLFAVSNPASISVILYPNHPPFDLPLYVIAFGALAIGFIFGAIILWLSMGKLRKERRQYKKNVKKLEKEISEMSDKLYESLSTQDKKDLHIIEQE